MWALSEVREKVYNFQKLPLDKSHFITEVFSIVYKIIIVDDEKMLTELL